MDALAHARDIIRSAIVWDNHTCLPIAANPDGYDDLLRMTRAGYRVISINAGFDLYPADHSLGYLHDLRQWLLARPENYAVAPPPEDIAAAIDSGRLVVLFDLEGIATLERDAGRIAEHHALGVRWMLLVYNRANAAGYGCHDAVDHGLTPFGREVVREMNACGLIVCCSHTGDRTAFDIVDASHRPVAITHSNARALHEHPRNVSDDLMRAVAATGGVVGINGMSAFLDEGPPTPAAMARHIDHAVQLLGPPHDGIAYAACIGNFDLANMLELDREIYPPGYGYDESLCTLEPETLPEVIAELVQLGYNDAALRAILGGNWMRLAQDGWKPQAS